MIPKQKRMTHAQSAVSFRSINQSPSLASFSSKASISNIRLSNPIKSELSQISSRLIKHNFLKKKMANQDFPIISADSYCVVSTKNKFEMVAGKRQSIKRKIASLTKIMTLHCALKLCKKFNVHSIETLVKIKKNAAETIGTTARICQSDYILLDDLFYAMMLPSGNDAAMALADFFGKRLKILEVPKALHKHTDRIQVFVNYMNREAIELGLVDTVLGN